MPSATAGKRNAMGMSANRILPVMIYERAAEIMGADMIKTKWMPFAAAIEAENIPAEMIAPNIIATATGPSNDEMRKVRMKDTSITLENLLEVNTVIAAEIIQDAHAMPVASVDPVVARGRGRERNMTASAMTVYAKSAFSSLPLRAEERVFV